MGSEIVLLFSQGQRNSEQIPIKAYQNRHLPTPTWILAHVSICQESSEPRTVGSSSQALRLCQMWCLVPDLCNQRWPSDSSKSYHTSIWTMSFHSWSHFPPIHGLPCSRQLENSHRPSPFKGQVALACKALGPFQGRSVHSNTKTMTLKHNRRKSCRVQSTNGALCLLCGWIVAGEYSCSCP